MLYKPLYDSYIHQLHLHTHINHIKYYFSAEFIFN
jgi:hypothetical protein